MVAPLRKVKYKEFDSIMKAFFLEAFRFQILLGQLQMSVHDTALDRGKIEILTMMIISKEYPYPQDC